MAVYAGMLDAADEQVGRLRAYLKQAGKLDNTVFILLSDNGADPYRLDKVFWFWYPFNYSVDYETLGERGSFSAYGQDWARVSNTPGYLFKGYAAEGGLRTPLIVSWPGRIPGGRTSNSFTHVKDIVPTVLELAGVPLPGDSYQGRPIARPDGASMLAHLDGQAALVHPAGQAVGYEMAGGMALYKDEMKLTRDLAPYGDEQWHLYDLRNDPTESNDLRAAQPKLFAAMHADMQAYLQANQVIPLPPGYNGIRQLMKNNAGLLLKMLWPYLAVLLLVLAGVLYGLWRGVRWLRRPRPAGT